MVIGVGEYGVATMLDDGVVNDGGYENLGGRSLATTATRAHRQVKGGDLAASLVLETDVDGCLVIAHLDIGGGEGITLYLVELGGYRLVLHRVCAVLVERLVHLHGRDGDVDVASAVRSLPLAVDGYLLDRACTAEVLPRGCLLP